MKKNIYYILILSFTVLAALVVSLFKWQLMLIHGDSMAPTYRNFSLVLLEKGDRCYRYGDVVLYRCDSIERDIVKRIAAVPGDEIQAADGMLLINNEEICSLPDSGLCAEYLSDRNFIIPDGRYFLLGDNTGHSIDSRYAQIGLADEEGIIGKVVTGDKARSPENGT